MIRTVGVLCLLSAVFCQPLSPPGAVKHIGVSYNGLHGNPEGSPSTNGGLDPGLDLLHKVLELTYDEEKETNGYLEPDQVEYNFGDTCQTVRNTDFFWGTQSYHQQRVDEHTRFDQDKNNLEGYEFTFSEGYSTVDSQTNGEGNIYYDERDVCSYGSARYMLEELEARNYPLNDGFVTDVCLLPDDYDETVFMNFLEKWGTDVVVSLELGKKTTTRFETARVDFVHGAAEDHPNSVSYSGPYLTYSDSLTVDMATYLLTATGIGSPITTLQTGDDELSEPIELEVISIDECLDTKFWGRFSDYVSRGLCSFTDLSELLSRQINLLKALQVYAEWKNADTPSDPIVQTAITWPQGLYGLPEVDTNPHGCPESPDFTYQTGWRYHDTADVFPSNDWSNPYNLKGPVYSNNMYQNFCMKEPRVVTTYDWRWMKGEYCIFRKDGTCPLGFGTGYVYWDDEDFNNGNEHGGSLPDGIYDEDTLIFYCCREDATPDHVMYLPTNIPFVLIKRTTNCPTVFGMTVSHQWFYWDCEDTGNESGTSGTHPYEDGGDENHRLHYCYYS